MASAARRYDNRDVEAPSPTVKKDARGEDSSPAAQNDKEVASDARRYGKEGKVDTSGINLKKLDAAQRAQVELGKAIAKALGVDVVFYESKAKDGVYRGAQGAYQDGVIRLDVNAGRVALDNGGEVGTERSAAA